MQITHQYKNLRITKKTDKNVGLLVGNDIGNYFYLPSGEETRYQGFFYANGKSYKDELSVYKIIDKINILNESEITGVENKFYGVSRNYKDGLTEEYFLPNSHDSLCVKMNRKVSSEIILDIRHPYDSRLLGRFYEIEIKDDCALIKFTKRRNWQEDGSEGKKESTIYLAIKTDKNNYKKIGEFFSKYYAKDHNRNSFPWDRFVYKSIRMEFKQAVFSVGKNPSEAIKEAEYVFKNFDAFREEEKENISHKLKFPKITDEEIKMAYLCAQNSINTLIIEDIKTKGAYAGLPWFFQFWTRDEAISLLEIFKLNTNLAQDIIKSQIELISSDGQIPRQRYGNPNLQSADALGWLMDRVLKAFDGGALPEYLKSEIMEKIEKSIPGTIKHRTVDDLAISYDNETWMDSLKRNGKRIEIQACRLKIYNALYKLTQNDQYQILEKELKDKVIENFYKDGILYDSPDDLTIRPNIFIAAYLYPELLSEEEWEVCFDKALEKLYLAWGGIATVDISQKEFIPKDTGENSPSYHNGNSWYWINNLCALALYRLNPHKYSKYINSIMEASTNDILCKGIIGHHSEMSSAENQNHEGCNAQLWSSAMYLEVFDEILGK